ncbi:uncharacterized protein N7477_004335 [Penicillium maclennaniae]|uniref:uncharacterized protein n=1 Tax=Penicillium maclennaniae TaxID=1343394 RepID=UPI0025408081|nr:uncharacterized protein N7477_004335 [Penicillium maclennaniae]KAJ5674401.1 hypothetical protein N7477_004335 [Penicillium maclennaniae]
MQPLVLHPPSLATAQFGQPRFNSGPERLPLSRPWSNARGCSPRASVLRQSMSGSPPAELPSVTSGEPKPSHPLSSPVVVTTGEPASSSTTAVPTPLVPNEPQLPQLQSRYGEQTAPAYVGSPRPLPGAPPYPSSTLESPGAGPATRSLVQKSTRRTKAHVASACVNCKKKHLGCDPARPCRRCVLAGKASSCVDVTHKKRGRPPLKAEDSSLCPYTSHMENAAVSSEGQPSAAPQRNIMHRATSSRELRPMTDLQVIDEPGQVVAAMEMPRGQSHRWSASVFPLTRPIDPSMMPTQAGRRPFSASGPPTYGAPSHPPPAFVPNSSGFNPIFRAGVMPPRMERRFAQYPSPALPPPTSPPQHMPAGFLTDHASHILNPHSDFLQFSKQPQVQVQLIIMLTVSVILIQQPGLQLEKTPTVSRAHQESSTDPQALRSHILHPTYTSARLLRQALSILFPGISDLLNSSLLSQCISLLQEPKMHIRAQERRTKKPQPIKRRKMALDDMVNG